MRPGQLESRWVRVGGFSLHMRVSTGPATVERPPLVLLHGLGVSSRYLVPLARRLAGTLPVYAPDLPGFGRSEGPDRALDVPALADALAAWMDEVGLEQAALLGNSMGCQVAVDCACRYPGRLGRLVLLDPTIDPSARTAWQQIFRLGLAALREPPGAWAVVLRDYLAFGLRRGWQTLRYALRDRVEDKLPRVDVPALVVRGEHDLICPPAWARQAARLLPHGRLAVLAGAGHIPNYSMPVELAALVLPFLLGEPAAPRPAYRALHRSMTAT